MAGSNLIKVACLVTLTLGVAALTGCNPPPRTPECGDGFLDVAYGEECDDGNDAPGDGCAPLFCTVEPMWECMDTTPLDGTPGTCLSLRCGDMRVTAGEACDVGTTATAACDADCTLPECGDGTLNRLAGEECDDDNVMAGDGCTPVCVVEPITCGDHICQLDGEETCDNCMTDCNADPMCNGCADADMDGYYSDACGGNDCDDTVATTHPDATDILCNDVDDDCSAATSGTTDADMDGWRCGLDCDDSNAAIAPMLTEVCGDGLDNDCNATTTDVGDGDGDGSDCMADCDDTNPAIAPGLREVCNNGVNDDCDPTTADVADIDGDGFFCNSPSECDDYEFDVHVGQPEIACDGFNNDCVLTTPDRPDVDMDGASSCAGAGVDCDDANPRRSPLLTEICGNGFDDDCNPATPDSQDIDGDTFDCAVDCNDADPAVYPDATGRCGARFLYTENFDDDASGWTVQIATMPAGRVSSWAWGVPSGAAKAFITGCAGGSSGCWVTSLTTDYLNNELGYVVSPAFDMSAVDVDPVMSFSHIFENQASADPTWIDISLDDGTTWTRLGAVGEGQNWYNQATPGAFRNTWDGTSGAAGAWRTASHELTGASGHAAVRVRFAFQSNVTTVRDGVAFDDIVIDNQRIDASVSGVTINRTSCGPTGSVDVSVTNLGQVVIPAYDVTLVVAGGTPIMQHISTALIVGATATINFPSISYTADPVPATATVVAMGDTTPGNDSVSASRGCVGAFPIPYAPLPTTGIAGPTGDDNVLSVPIGFTFRFFGTNYTNAVISTNGFISFDAAPGSGCCSGQALPNASAPNNLIAAGWTDLLVSAGQLVYETRGTAPNRTFVVSYTGVPSLSGTGNLTAQIILYETSNRVAIQTTTLTMPGRTTTQGVEGPGGTMAYFLPGRTASGTISLMNDGVEFYTN
jgi:cysteine-rich repeat protein